MSNDSAAESLTLYHFASCPFCVRVRRYMAAEDIRIPERDVLRDPEARRELYEGGGSTQVPCLKIEQGGGVRWLYESLDIIEFLRERLPALRGR